MTDVVLIILSGLLGAAVAYTVCVLAATADCRACRQRMTSERLRRECDKIDLNTLDWWYGDAVTWPEVQGMMTPRLPKG